MIAGYSPTSSIDWCITCRCLSEQRSCLVCFHEMKHLRRYHPCFYHCMSQRAPWWTFQCLESTTHHLWPQLSIDAKAQNLLGFATIFSAVFPSEKHQLPVPDDSSASEQKVTGNTRHWALSCQRKANMAVVQISSYWHSIHRVLRVYYSCGGSESVMALPRFFSASSPLTMYAHD